MSYEVHYTLPFKRLDGVDCRFDILEKDYVGYPVTLIGASRSPVVHSWDGSDVLDPIQGSKVVVQFVYERSGVSIADLLTTDETFFRGDLYVNDVLQFTGFMVIDDFSEPYLYAPTETTLTFTDGLALLDNVTLSDAGYNVRSGRKTISEIIENILTLTNLDLSLTNYYNLFPYKTGYYVDRDDVPGIDAFELQYINTNSFLASDDSFEDCKEVLTRILKANKSVLRQVKGEWVIVRVPEYKRFTGVIPGSTNTSTPLTLTAGFTTSFSIIGIFTFTGQASLISYFLGVDDVTVTNSTDSDFDRVYPITTVSTSGSDLIVTVSNVAGLPDSTITADFLTVKMKTAAPGLTTLNVGTDLIPIDRSQLKQYTSPVKRITDTYNYKIPQLLTNSNLTRLGTLIGTSTDGDNTYTDYELSDWENQTNEAAFIRVVTNTDTGKEVERYIVMPFIGEEPTAVDMSALKSVEIEVSEGDRFNLSFLYKARTGPSDKCNSFVTAILHSLDGTVQKVLVVNTGSNPALNGLYWNTVYNPDVDNVRWGLPQITVSKDGLAENWQAVDLINQYDYNDKGMAPFPFDGILKIGFTGFNNIVPAFGDVDYLVKDFNFTYLTYINDSVRIEGQVHNATNDVTNKKDINDQLFVDSSPKFNIAGGIFCWDGTRIALADLFTKQSGGTDKYLHGEVNTIDEILLKSNWRIVFEGEFSGYCSPLDSFTIDNLDGLYLPYKLSIDYRQNRCSASFYEVSKDTDSTFADMTYAFRYLYKIEGK